MKVLLIVAAILVSSVHFGEAAIAQYSCSNDGVNKVMTFTLESQNDTIAALHALGKFNNCSTTYGQITGNGTAGNLYTLVLNLTSGQSPDCGATETSPGVWQLIIIQQTNAVFLQVDDLKYNMTCDLSLPSNMVEVTIEGLSVADASSNYGIGNAINNAPSVTMELLSGGNVITNPTFGEDVKLRLEIVNKASINGIRILRLTASPDAAFTTTATLISDGCPETSNNVFAGNSAFEGANADGSIAESSPFKMIQFPMEGADRVYFKALIQYCLGAGDTTCSGSHCTAARRKRDVSDPPENDEVVGMFIISRGDPNNRGNSLLDSQGDNEHTNNGPLVPEGSTCLNNVTFIAVVAMMALLLLTAASVAIFFGAKLTRRTAGATKNQMA